MKNTATKRGISGAAIVTALLAVLLTSTVLTGVSPSMGASDELSSARESLAREAPNWKLYWAQREGHRVSYYVSSDPILYDSDPGGRGDFLRMTLTLWEDASEYWASLPPYGQMGTCTIALTRAADAMTTDGTTTEIIRVNQFIGAAQADIEEAMSVNGYRDMGDREFLSWLREEFPSCQYSPHRTGSLDDVLSEGNADSYVSIVPGQGEGIGGREIRLRPLQSQRRSNLGESATSKAGDSPKK